MMAKKIITSALFGLMTLAVSTQVFAQADVIQEKARRHEGQWRRR